MSSKRRSEFQLIKDGPEEDDDNGRYAIDPVQVADASVLATRKYAGAPINNCSV